MRVEEGVPPVPSTLGVGERDAWRAVGVGRAEKVAARRRRRRAGLSEDSPVGEREVEEDTLAVGAQGEREGVREPECEGEGVALGRGVKVPPSTLAVIVPPPEREDLEGRGGVAVE